MVCLSVSSEGEIKILNMSNNAGRPSLETEFVVSIRRPMNSQ